MARREPSDPLLGLRARPVAALLLALGLALGCEAPDPDADGDLDADAALDAGADAEPDAEADRDADQADRDADLPSCEPGADDYRPGAEDRWPACISDDGRYHLVDAWPSSVARVVAFEQIAALLFGERAGPEPQAFLDARVLYTAEQGLDSRVQRREDEHYPPATDPSGAEAACQDEGVAALPANRERCAGPALVLPILNEAFAAGIRGERPELQAARIEAALLWFLYLSVYKEAATCATTPRDCDSSWAYLGGGEEPPGGLGLADYLRAAEPAARARSHDGLLAVRCWRDLADRGAIDAPAPVHELALGQLDRALLRGLAAIVSRRTEALEAAAGRHRAAHWELARILGRVLDREATVRDGALAGRLRAALGPAEPSEADLPELRRLLAELFPCP